MKELGVPIITVSALISPAHHSYHQHVNPFQIESIDAVEIGVAEYDEANNDRYKVGDWHDVMMYPTNNTDPIDKLRYAADSFSGHIVFY